MTVESSGMPPSEGRVAEIESLFRNVNERIATAAENYDVERAEFFCECPDPACGERVVVSLDEYERVRDESTRFVHAVEHVEPKFERVVARRAKYAVVETFGRSLTRTPARPASWADSELGRAVLLRRVCRNVARRRDGTVVPGQGRREPSYRC